MCRIVGFEFSVSRREKLHLKPGLNFFHDRYEPKRKGERKQFSPWRWLNGKWEAKAFSKPRPLYGLDRLQAEAMKVHKKAFAQLDAGVADGLLAPLRKPWSNAPAADPFARFLREVQDDLLQATANSREYAQAMSRRSRSASGVNAYWLPLD